MSEAIKQKNWSRHPLGPLEDWTERLKTTVSIVLHSEQPMAVYWGKENYAIFNDKWLPLIGESHSASLGMPVKDILGDVWPLIGPQIKKVSRTGRGYKTENTMLPMVRNGKVEECYFDYTFNPILSDNGKVDGVVNIGAETTLAVLGRRRNRLLRKLSERSIKAETPEAACILAANTLSELPEDIAYSLIYLLSEDNKGLKLVATTSVDSDKKFAKKTIDLRRADNIMEYVTVINSGSSKLVNDLDKKYSLPGGIWDEPSRQAVVLPIQRPATKELFGVLVIGISPRLPYNDAYEQFISQAAELVAFSVGRAFDYHREMELSMREHAAKEQLDAALTSGSIGIWSWDVSADTVTADRNTAKFFGLSESFCSAGFPLSVLTAMIDKSERKKVISTLKRGAKSTKRIEIECRIKDKTGKQRWLIFRGRSGGVTDSAHVRVQGVIVDITERKKVEEELASSEKMFSALFESSILGVVVASLDGKLHNANETFLKIFGYTKADLKKGLSSKMITPAHSRSITSLIFQRLREKGEVEPTEKEYVRKDGSLIPMMIGAVMIPGSKDRFIAFMLDISEQKQLKALSKSKDEFISIASHQLRTPATGVKQYLGMLIEGYVGDLTDAQMKILKTAYRSNERQLRIVNDLLRVAQADAGEVKLRKEKVDITDTLQDILGDMSARLLAKGQDVIFDHPEKPIYSLVDPLHIRMVFENILDNAHKYSNQNQPITVRLSEKNGKISISIKDKGVGIHKEDMPRLFKKFSRIENPLSMAAGGTGLGLYWVNKIIGLHKGSIRAKSSYGFGTEFLVKLPSNTKTDVK